MTTTEHVIKLADTGVPVGEPGRPLLVPAPRVVLGGADPLVGPVLPSPTTLFGPRGARVTPDGTLVVVDTGHHRVLVWNQVPTEDGAPADLVLGQPTFEREGRNAQGDTTDRTMNAPTGVALCGDGLIVADTWNNRVLIWHQRPTRSGQAADVILGQLDGAGMTPNRGGEPGPDTLHWPTQALLVDGKLLVCDVGNRRVLVWGALPTRHGQPADLVLGQPDLRSRSDNGGAEAGPRGLRWPHDVAWWRGQLVVADAGDNRLLVFDGLPTCDHAEARTVVGQRDLHHVDHNQSRYWPSARTLNMPYAVEACGELLVCADTANSRLVAYTGALAADLPASHLAGQPHFAAKGDNRWGEPVRDSVCWPYAIELAPDERTLVVSDTGNHRVCLWELAP